MYVKLFEPTWACHTQFSTTHIKGGQNCGNCGCTQSVTDVKRGLLLGDQRNSVGVMEGERG